MVNIKFNGKECAVAEGLTIVEAARENGVNIPTLCWLKDMNEIGACRICVVEMDGARSLVASCVYKLSKFDEGKNILTQSPTVLESRKTTLQLMLSDHNRKCLSCVMSGGCELQTLCREAGVDDENRFEGETKDCDTDNSAAHMYRDNSKCINCRRCVAACEHQRVGVIGANERGFRTEITCAFDMPLAETACVSCGQCINVCPTGALSEKDDTGKVWEALNDPEKVVVVQTAPAVRAALGEAFGLPVGTCVEGKMATALRKLGFDAVFDTNFGADLTIMEESNELIGRIKNNGVLPMITSCSPGWIRYCEAYYPELLPNLSSCKSPQQMNGAITKTYWAEKMNVDPAKIVSVSVMPCTAKKFEISRRNQSGQGTYPDLDISITTRELARMIDKARIRFADLPDGGFDSPLGNGSGAAVIFGATGGVMEAALRTAVWKLTGEDADSPIEFKEVRGVKGVKTAACKANGVEINVAVASGLDNARTLIEKVKSGEIKAHFIEIMACPGGCVNGGGQIRVPSQIRNFTDIRAERAGVLYRLDENNKVARKSHESPDIKQVYGEFLSEPGSHKAHELLHTSYKASNLRK
ncbi:MAG: [FeFe] hydrogenase, group A [Oscillospiraceae bacterium]|jgi:NADP-reducing hydrogenase subunit HndD|nr:[FeFe] hydrogenase, group A [Oscillospiraceae bacterium]